MKEFKLRGLSEPEAEETNDSADPLPDPPYTRGVPEYVNAEIEAELREFKKEIERRFLESKANQDYRFPRRPEHERLPPPSLYFKEQTPPMKEDRSSLIFKKPPVPRLDTAKAIASASARGGGGGGAPPGSIVSIMAKNLAKVLHR